MSLVGHIGRVIVAAPRDPAIPRHLGFEVAGSVEEAVAMAETAHGAGSSIDYVKQPAPASLPVRAAGGRGAGAPPAEAST